MTPDGCYGDLSNNRLRHVRQVVEEGCPTGAMKLRPKGKGRVAKQIIYHEMPGVSGMSRFNGS